MVPSGASRIAGSRVALMRSNAGLPSAPRVAAVRRDLLDLRLAGADVRHAAAADSSSARTRPGHALRRPARGSRGRRCCPAACRSSSSRWAARSAIGRVVLVERCDQDALGVGAGGLGQRLAPAVVGVVADLAPVDRDQDDRAATACPPRARSRRLERVDDRPRRRDPAAHQGWPSGGVTSAEKGVSRPRAEEPVGRANVRAALGNHACRQPAQGVATRRLSQ